MLYFWVNLYSNILNKNELLTKVRFYSMLRFLVRTLASWMYFTFKTDTVLSKSKKKKERIIVSLTSFPPRLPKLWLVLESIMGQSLKPDEIIVWLCANEIDSLNHLPRTLKKMQTRGVTFRLSAKNLKSYNKFYFACQEYPDDYIITIDDDILYPKDLIKNLFLMNKRYPSAVCCNVGMLMNLNDGKDWPSLEEEEVASRLIMAQGVGGILYPPKSLPELAFREEIFTKICPKDDDTWLQVMEYLNHVLVVKGRRYFSLYPLRTENDVKLCSSNCQETALVRVNHIRKYLLENTGKDPYEFEKQD